MKGFKYKKFDLHLHTNKKDGSTDNKNTVTIDENNVDNFYKKLIENKIELIAITNHNYFDYENYDLIKNKLENNKEEGKYIKVLPGIEMNVFFKQIKKNIEFQMNIIFDDEDAKKLKNIISNFYSNDDIKKSKNIEDVVSFLSKNNIKGILIPDVGKSSTKIDLKQMDNDFWFYFDFFEGNVAFEKEKWNREFNKLKNELKVSESKVANSVFGTDNIDFNIYPNRGNRQGWTGTFFGTEASFDGLRLAIYFKHLIKKLDRKTYDDSKKNDKNYLPKLEEITINNFDGIHLDRGLNVIYGKRGSGKTHFIKQIKKKLSDKRIMGLKVLDQNEVTIIIEKLKTDEASFISKNNDKTQSKEEWNEEIKTKIIKNFSNIFNKDINKENYKSIVKDISNVYTKIVNNEISDINFDIEQDLISKINVYFSKFNNEFESIKNDLKMISKIEFHDVAIGQIFKENFQFEEFIKKIDKVINEKIKNIKFNIQKNNIERKTNHELNMHFKESFKKLQKILEKNKTLFNNVIKKMKDLNENKNNWIFLFKDVKVFSSEVKVVFELNCGDLEKLGKYFKIKNLTNVKDNIFWYAEYNKIINKSFEESIQLNWEYKMGDDFINKLSPGQRVNKYINNLFNDVSNKILLVDQPEDQLDAESATKSIIDPIINRYQELIDKGIQIIMISHDPKIIINTGPIKLINTFFKDDKYDIQNISLVEFIKDEKNINIVDGKREFVHERSDIYGRNKN